MAKDKDKNVSGIPGTVQPGLSCGLGQETALNVKPQLIDNLAYQIRTLSNAIIGFSNLLSAEDLTDTQQEYVNEIHQAGRGLSCIVNDVLDLARIESGNLRPDYAECDLADLLEDIENAIGRAAAQKGLGFNVIPSGTLPARIHTDPARLKRCLLNLAGNAIQYTHQGYVHILIRLEANPSRPMIRFDIVDTGVGIDSSHLQTIFDPIQKTERINSGMLASINLGVQGCGLLSITRRLVELLGGRIEVTSETGVGSTFSILLPVGVDVHRQPALVYPPSPEDLKSDEDREEKQCVGHVLLVEDEESNRTVLSLMLENLGLEVTTASEGRQAVAAVREKSFDAILMDIQLPDMNGYEVTRQLRQMGLAAPVIALSAGVLSDGDDRRIAELFNAFLAKPVDGPQLAEVLQSFLPTIRKQTLTASPAARGPE
jgi:CheY-like chemotaxis protein